MCPSAYHMVYYLVSAMMAIGIPIIRLLVTDGGWHADCRRVC